MSDEEVPSTSREPDPETDEVSRYTDGHLIFRHLRYSVEVCCIVHLGEWGGGGARGGEHGAKACTSAQS